MRNIKNIRAMNDYTANMSEEKRKNKDFKEPKKQTTNIIIGEPISSNKKKNNYVYS